MGWRGELLLKQAVAAPPHPSVTTTNAVSAHTRAPSCKQADADALVKVDGYKKDAKIDTEVGVGVGVGGVRGLARQDWCWCRLMLALAPALLARLLEALLTFCVLATLLLLCRLRWRPRDVSGQAGWACDRA